MAVDFPETAESPERLETWVTLPNGRRVRIRPLGRAEEETVRRLYAHLSERTRYQRFLFVARDLPEPVLRLLVAVEEPRRVALVAEDAGGESTAVVALGSFASLDGESAELGLVVRDDWQRQRVGTVLARKVMDAAESRGCRRFIANMLSDNTAIRRIVKASGEIVSTRIDGGLAEIVFMRRAPSTS